MNTAYETCLSDLLERLRQVQSALGQQPVGPQEGEVVLADELDSMGLVEFVAAVAEGCGVRAELIEEAVGRRFTTVGALAEALTTEGLSFRFAGQAESSPAGETPKRETICRLSEITVRLPETVQPAELLDEWLGRPRGWLERRTGIRQRRVWGEQDPLAEAAEAGRSCLETAGALPEEVGALLVTSEAPPLLAGLAAALHHRLGLRPQTPALEVGGACTGFLAALWLARALAPQVGSVLIVAVESPSRYLRVEPGPEGEAAALFGDGAAACLVGVEVHGADMLRLIDMDLQSDGAAGDLLRPSYSRQRGVTLRMEGRELAGRAVALLAEGTAEAARACGLDITRLGAVVIHAGNGRMAEMVARRLGLPPERVWSQTAVTGNLGSVSLPMACAVRSATPEAPVAWVAVGAGLTAGWAVMWR